MPKQQLSIGPLFLISFYFHYNEIHSNVTKEQIGLFRNKKLFEILLVQIKARTSFENISNFFEELDSFLSDQSFEIFKRCVTNTLEREKLQNLCLCFLATF